MAGFLVLVKRGRILSFRTVSRCVHRVPSERVVALKPRRMSIEIRCASSVDQGSASEVKLASATRILGMLAALPMECTLFSPEMTVIACVSFCFSSAMAASLRSGGMVSSVLIQENRADLTTGLFDCLREDGRREGSVACPVIDVICRLYIGFKRRLRSPVVQDCLGHQ